MFLIAGACLFPAATLAVPDGLEDMSNKYPDVVLLKAGRGSCSGIVADPSFVLTGVHCFLDSTRGSVLYQGDRMINASIVKITPEDGPDELRPLVQRLEKLPAPKPTGPFALGDGAEEAATGLAWSIVSKDAAIADVDQTLPKPSYLVLPRRADVEGALARMFRKADGGGYEGVMVGFGPTSYCGYGQCPKPFRNYKPVKMIPTGACGNFHRDRYFYDGTICVTALDDDDILAAARTGDSGGALFLKTNDGRLVLVGMVSVGGRFSWGQRRVTMMVAVHEVLDDLEMKSGHTISIPVLNIH